MSRVSPAVARSTEEFNTALHDGDVDQYKHVKDRVVTDSLCHATYNKKVKR